MMLLIIDLWMMAAFRTAVVGQENLAQGLLESVFRKQMMWLMSARWVDDDVGLMVVFRSPIKLSIVLEFAPARLCQSG